MKFVRSLIFILVTFCNLPVCLGSPMLDHIEEYLNSIKTIKAQFEQYSPDGSVRYGNFYLSKPGKVKWKYNPPKEAIIIGTKKTIIYYDYELEQINHIPTSSVLAYFLTYGHIKFGENIKVIDYFQTTALSEITIASTDQDNPFTLVLKIQNNPLSLYGLSIIDQNYETIDIVFRNAEYNIPISDSEFDFRNPKFFTY